MMNITLWVLQALLALVFLAHGVMFLVPPPDIAVQMNAMLPRWFQRVNRHGVPGNAMTQRL